MSGVQARAVAASGLNVQTEVKEEPKSNGSGYEVRGEHGIKKWPPVSRLCAPTSTVVTVTKQGQLESSRVARGTSWARFWVSERHEWSWVHGLHFQGQVRAGAMHLSHPSINTHSNLATNTGECKGFTENAGWVWKHDSAHWLARQDVAEKWEENWSLPEAEGRSVHGR